jgi:ferrochelatase
MRKGLLLVNLGTPESPTTEKVREYLAEFLMDPDVIDIPYPLRWLLVHGAILPKRPAASAEAYRKVWTDRGSPLMNFHLDLTDQVRIELENSTPGKWSVEAAMRYGQPSIESKLRKLAQEGIKETHIFPLYPQYSLAATRSSVEETRRAAQRVASQTGTEMRLKFLPAFYQQKDFIEAFAQVARTALADYNYNHLLFSFHGLPERQIKKTDPTGGKHCLADASCCDEISDVNRDCYRAQSFQTAHAIARALQLPREKYTVCFQSRLGRTPWIQPFTDVLYAELPKKGVRKLAVMCPAFVADCLETLEEIQIRGRADFIAQGGEELKLVPSLNATSGWVSAVAKMVGESS